MPLVNSSSFSIPFSNVIILLFSSLPIQATIVFYKVGLFFSCIEQLGQAVSCGTCFLVLQLKEFLYSFHSLTDCMIGSIFYFTTGLHGAHVLFGLLYFYLILVCFSLTFSSAYALTFNFNYRSFSLLFVCVLLLNNFSSSINAFCSLLSLSCSSPLPWLALRRITSSALLICSCLRLLFYAFFFLLRALTLHSPFTSSTSFCLMLWPWFDSLLFALCSVLLILNFSSSINAFVTG